MNESISIINSIELIPLEDTEINPFLTRVRIKVFHLGENRNHSFIDKQTAISMAKTLRGNPIVARYRVEDQDFTDHGQEIVINDKGVTYKTLTRPYGFVGETAKVWFEDFNDTGENGQILKHTYVVTEGYIWTEIYEELKNTILDGGRPQSMELDEKTLQGHWSDDVNPNYEIFIINDAIITKLCALGENTEPCFLGASIEPIFSSLDSEDNFVKDLLDFKAKFSLALNNEGGNSMEENTNIEVQSAEEPVTEEVAASEVTPEENNENFSNSQDNVDSEISTENQNITEEFSKKEEDEDKNDSEDSDSKTEDETGSGENEDEDEKKKASKNTLEQDYALLQTDFEELQNKFSALEEQNKKLLEFKLEVENKQKDELINSFYMLSDEDKKDVIENKASYSLDDIESKLSVICVRKKVNFNLEDEAKVTEESPIATFNLESAGDDNVPAWIKAVEARKNVD